MNAVIESVPVAGTVREIPVDQIRTDRTQSRAAMDDATIAEYAELAEAGVKLPAAIVYFDGEDYWLADGFHRLAAARKRGADDLKCEVRMGWCRDALKHSLSANVTHGLRRTNEDKRHSVKLALEDEVWSTWSDRAIADLVGVSHVLVARVRAELATGNGYQLKTGGDTKEATDAKMPCLTNAIGTYSSWTLGSPFFSASRASSVSYFAGSSSSASAGSSELVSSASA